MAEVVGLVASVIQVAGAGLKLSQTLYQYADGVATADRRIKDIAKEIELTSFVIEDLGAIFNQEENATIISNNAVRTANETMKECSNVFAEISATLKKSRKNTFGRLMLPFRDPKIQLLRDHIDKLKSTLTLLMQVLSHAHLVKSNKLGKEAIARQREEIKTLLEQKKISTKKYEESLRNYSGSEDGTLVDDDILSNRELDQQSSTNTLSTLSADSTINLDSLGKCVNHIRNLLENIETLQQALTNQVDGDDNSEHHQSLIGSYFKTRSHLDEVLFGSSRSSTVRASIREIKIGIEKSLTGSTHRSDITLTNTAQVAEDAGAQSSAEEIQKLKRGTEALRVEKETVKLEAERKLHEYETLLKASQLKLEIELDKSSKAQAARSLDIKRQPPIKFQDTLGRKYVLPFQACNTWQGMHDMIKKVYLQDSKWQQQISDERYHLMDADGSILLPAFWESLVEPGSMITMVFLPTTPVDNRSDKSKSDPILGLPKDNTETVGFAEPVSRKETPPVEEHDAGQVVEDIDRPKQGEDPLPGSSHDMDVDLDAESLSLPDLDMGLEIDVPDEAPGPRSRRKLPASYHGGGYDPNTWLSEPKQLIISHCGGGGFDPNSSSSKPNSDVKTGHPDVEAPDITINPVDPSPSKAKTMEELQAEIEATIPIMRDNIHRVSQRGARLDSLNDKTDNLAVSAQGFRRAANQQRTSGLWDSVYNWFSAPAIPSAASDTSNDAGDGTWNWSFGNFGNDRKRLQVERRLQYENQNEIVIFERRFVPPSPPVDEVDEILREWTTVFEE